MFAALQRKGGGTPIEELIFGKRLLHFAPEKVLQRYFREKAGKYVTADFLALHCDLKLDISNMKEVPDEQFDTLVACDVLEHVPDDFAALKETFRVLTRGGTAILTVPQQDGLNVTFEDPSINTPEQRTKCYGQWDHLRIYGNDFADRIRKAGFEVTVVDEKVFSGEQVKRQILFPPVLSKHPLATNHRKVFFAKRPMQ